MPSPLLLVLIGLVGLLVDQSIQTSLIPDAAPPQQPIPEESLHRSLISSSSGVVNDEDGSANTGVVCRVTSGVDIPGNDIAAYTFEESCDCCKKCQSTAGCKSWVYNRKTKLCKLKSKSFENAGRVYSADCIAYNPTGNHFIACMGTESTNIAERDIKLEGGKSSHLKFHNQVESFGLIGDYTTWSHAGGIWMPEFIAAQLCTMSFGYDQPAKYNLGPLTYMRQSYDCCNACAKLPETCKSWVYHMKSKMCQLKNNYVPYENKKICADCMMYDMTSEHYVYQLTPERTLAVYKIKWSASDPSTWKEDSFGEDGAWSRSAGPETDVCTFGAGFDQPAAFNLGKPLNLSAAFMCCDACNSNNQCKSWVWKARTHECYLKIKYDSERNLPCDDCVAYRQNGEYVLYSESEKASHTAVASKYDLSDWRSWPRTEGIWMIEEIAQRKCNTTVGMDQPAKYNLEPATHVDQSYDCCNACAKRMGECKSWVFNQKTHMCQLKNNYVPSENTIPCEDCMMYDASSTLYVYQLTPKRTIVVYTVAWSASDPSSWKADSFGEGGAWSKSTGSKMDVCTFAPGFDQPTDYNIGKPLNVSAAFMCCDACNKNKQCKSWVWKARTHECYLKNKYSADRDIPCADCVAYRRNGEFVLYASHRRLLTPAFKYDLSDARSWPRKDGIWMIKEIAAAKCRATDGFDQPAKYNLGPPISATLSYQCCNACAERMPECKSWVFNEKKKECQLKNNYVPSENILPCDDCKMYDFSSSTFVYQAYPEQKMPMWPTKFSSLYLENIFGRGGAWSKATGCSTDICTFVAGFDQPGVFNLGEPLDMSAAYMCCDACTKNEQCKSWVWMRTTSKCYLKSQYDASRSTIPCADCVSYQKNGEYVLYSASKTEGSEFNPKYDLDDWRTWPKSESIWMIEEIAQHKCRVKTGYDQPAKYNLDAPIKLPYVYQCCNACARRMPDCKSWVFNQRTKECQLKKAHVPEENVPCSKCWMYDMSGETFVHQQQQCSNTH